MRCAKCDEHIDDLSQKGVYLSRTNPKGEKGIFECAPICGYDKGTQEEAFLNALEDSNNASKDGKSLKERGQEEGDE